MKPEHFINIQKRKNCEECDYLREAGDDDEVMKSICTLHDFTLPSRTNDYRCEDFKEVQ
jgi:hypothetical protein